ARQRAHVRELPTYAETAWGALRGQRTRSDRASVVGRSQHAGTATVATTSQARACAVAERAIGKPLMAGETPDRCALSQRPGMATVVSKALGTARLRRRRHTRDGEPHEVTMSAMHLVRQPGARANNAPLISVIIPNFNYEAYVGAAIDSALQLDWPRVEIIVVDDGSTDGSRAVLARYGSRIRTILQENAGQLVACNRGFAASSGDIVIFLDSDDVLHRSLARELAAVWTPRVSKVQVQMRTIDAHGRPLG